MQVQSWIVPAALLLLTCNAPAGAIAVLLAVRTQMHARAGDEEGARRTSQLAALACLLTVPVGFAVGCSGYGLDQFLP